MWATEQRDSVGAWADSSNQSVHRLGKNTSVFSFVFVTYIYACGDCVMDAKSGCDMERQTNIEFKISDT